MTMRVHITGGSGSGTTTLGAHLALALDAPHADADDYFWVPTDPPYRTRRPIPERHGLMEQIFLPRDRWVLSGSIMKWSDPLCDRFDLVVVLELSPEQRMARLRAREKLAYGARIGPGGDMEQAHHDFMAWAESYDDPSFSGRSAANLTKWTSTLTCPVLSLDSARPVQELVEACQKALDAR